MAVTDLPEPAYPHFLCPLLEDGTMVFFLRKAGRMQALSYDRLVVGMQITRRLTIHQSSSC